MKPGILKGTRDFGPVQVRRRNFIFDTIRKVFIKYGFEPIETPAMENLQTLTGKYGEEGDKLLFKVLNNGDYLKKANPEALAAKDSKKLTSSIAKRGMRYDLTVPFARFVVMHQNDIVFPFKRYQIQPVWRADNPQKGRYQEFFQCDADVVGSDSLIYEAELAKIYDEVFHELKIPVQIKLNNRKILFGLAEVAGIKEQMMDMTIAIDKLDKIGADGVRRELEKKEISSAAIDKIINALQIKDLTELKNLIGASELGAKGIEELEAVFNYLSAEQTYNDIQFDITLARGLNYYTGCIFEVATQEVKIGSIGGGGRYDDLTAVFGLKNVSGVGISFGADRIYDVLQELDRFPDSASEKLQIMLVAFDQETHDYAWICLTKLRKAGIVADLYPAPVKMKKQMKYANAKGVPKVAVIGSEEMSSGKLTIKDMESGNQDSLTIEELIQSL